MVPNFLMRSLRLVSEETTLLTTTLKLHQFVTPQQGCRGAQSPGRSARCPRILPFSSPAAAGGTRKVPEELHYQTGAITSEMKPGTSGAAP
jgi:hypothetical protein